MGVALGTCPVLGSSGNLLTPKIVLVFSKQLSKCIADGCLGFNVIAQDRSDPKELQSWFCCPVGAGSGVVGANSTGGAGNGALMLPLHLGAMQGGCSFAGFSQGSFLPSLEVFKTR